MEYKFFKALDLTLQSTAEAFFKENRMGWLSERKRFIKSFMEELEEHLKNDRL